MAAMLWLGVTATVIIPYKVKYNKVKYVKKMYQKNLTTVHSNPIIAYTTTPYISVWVKMCGSSTTTCIVNILIRPIFNGHRKISYNQIRKDLYLSESIWESRVHSGSPFSVKHGSFHRHNRLHRCSILNSNKQYCTVHRSHSMEDV